MRDFFTRCMEPAYPVARRPSPPALGRSVSPAGFGRLGLFFMRLGHSANVALDKPHVYMPRQAA
jgi:hypothetical protein